MREFELATHPDPEQIVLYHRPGVDLMLKNVTRLTVENGCMGRTIDRLIDSEGNFIDAFDRFSRHLILQSYPFTTRKRYSESCARFIDYLFEVGVLGVDTTSCEINHAVALYPIFLRDGPNFIDTDIALGQSPQLEPIKLRDYARKIGMKRGLAPNSFPPALAAVNLFLSVVQDLAREDCFLSGETNQSAIGEALSIEAINGFVKLSTFERRRLRENSMLAAVKRQCGELKRPRGVKSRNQVQQIDQQRLDFPLNEFPKLISAATNFRDKALWTLLGASGIRISEAMNLQLEHIDPVLRQVYVLDPDFVRFGDQMTLDEKRRFKGRVTSRTYLFEPLKSEFFKLYEQYLLGEFTPTRDHAYVFQIIGRKKRGLPYRSASDGSRNESFKNALFRARIPGCGPWDRFLWTPHSLRHMYGVYMRNYIPVPGGFGLLDSEVQTLMGHKDIKSTQHYARQDEIILKQKLEIADQLIYDEQFDFTAFPSTIADRLRMQAETLKTRARTNHD